MKTQASQQNTPKCYDKYFRGDSCQSRTPVKQESFLNLYEKYLNCQGKAKVNDVKSPLQQSTSLHYLTKKQEVGVHRFSLDNFNQDKSKGLKSYLTTINSSNSIQNIKASSSYFPNNKNDSSQGRSQTADGQSILTDESKPNNNDKLINQEKRLNQQLSGINQIAQLLKSTSYQKMDRPKDIDLKKVLSKTRTLLDTYRKDHRLLQFRNHQLKEELRQKCDQLRMRDEEISHLKQIVLNK